MKTIKPAWMPTPIGNSLAPIRTLIPEPPSCWRGWHIAAALLRIGWAALCRRSPAHLGRLTRDQFEALGGLWLKVGQILSLRLDLFPAAFCRELTALQGRATGFCPTLARAVIDRDIDLLRTFATFEHQPRFAASLGQVHRARLRSGQWVAVKVRRPFVEEAFLGDLAVLTRWARILNRVAPKYRLLDGVAELRRTVIEELDFRFEANGQRRMGRTLEHHRGVYAPRIFRRLCTARVCVSEWVDGTLMGDYLALLARDPAAAWAWCAANAIKTSRVAGRLIGTLFRQVLEDDRFHGDLHPSNILLLRGNRIVLIDFGSTGSTERAFLAKFTDQLRAVVAGEYERAADLCLMMCASVPGQTLRERIYGRQSARLATMRAALVAAMQAWATRTEVSSLDYYAKSMEAFTQALMQIVFDAGGHMRWEWMRIKRAMSTLDASVAGLDHRLNYRRAVKRYLKKAAARGTLLADLVAHTVEQWDEYARLKTAHERQRAYPITGSL